MTHSPTAEELRAQHDLLQSALATRTSTLHFAHAGVALVVSLVTGGTTARLLWKPEPAVPWALGVFGAVTLAVLAYAAVRALLGRRALVKELQQFARFQELRRELGLDQPAGSAPA